MVCAPCLNGRDAIVDDALPAQRPLQSSRGLQMAARPDMSALETVDFDRLLVETQALVLVRQELLDLVALITLELDHVAHALGVGIVNDGAIASWRPELAYYARPNDHTLCRASLPNSFLTTLRIFLWSNFFGIPWTVVKVLRPLRSMSNVSQI